jgi:hypothetical protein
VVATEDPEATTQFRVVYQKSLPAVRTRRAHSHDGESEGKGRETVSGKDARSFEEVSDSRAIDIVKHARDRPTFRTLGSFPTCTIGNRHIGVLIERLII